MMMWPLTPARVLMGLVAVSTVIQQSSSQTTTQDTVNYAAANLEVTAIVRTNHIIGQQFQVQLQLKNRGTNRILDDPNWRIYFTMRQGSSLTQREFTENGLRINRSKGCFFVISKNPGANPPFNGLMPNENSTITMVLRGLSVFRYDIDNNFVMTARNLYPRTINSTTDKNLGFVFLDPVNRTDDYSTRTPYDRFIGSQGYADLRGLGESMVLPRPKTLVTPEMEAMASMIAPPRMPPPARQTVVDLSENQIKVQFDTSISNVFKAYFKEQFLSIDGVTPSQLTEVNTPAGPGLYVSVELTADPTMTADGYRLVINGTAPNRNYNITRLSANTETGLCNGVQTIKSLAGVFNVIPIVNIDDDADTKRRMVKLDVTKNFIPVPHLQKFLDFMHMYKYNELVLVFGSDDAMRISFNNEINDFPELELFGSNYCNGKNIPKCNPNYYSGATDFSTASSGIYTTEDIKNLVEYAYRKNINLVPRVNIIGSLRSAKKASHLRFKRLESIDKTSADRFHLMSNEPSMASPPGSCYNDGVLDPCSPSTINFAFAVIDYFKSIYSVAGVPFTAFHAGGDGFTKFFGQFASCQAMGYNQAASLNYILNQLQTKLSDVTLMVHEHAVLDINTGTCLEKSTRVDLAKLIVEFTDMAPGLMEDWNLTSEQKQFLLREVRPYNESDPNDVPDVDRRFSGTKKGIAPWSKCYDCANYGYKTVLSPDSFFDFSNPYELDFNEPATHKPDGFYIIDLGRLMDFEPYNIHINMGTASSGATYLPYRFAEIFKTPTLMARENIVGMQASLDMPLVRNEYLLEYNSLRFIMAAEKMWNRGEFENLLKAEDSSTLKNMTLGQMRTAIRQSEYVDIINTMGYKELGRLDKLGITYRIPKLEAHIDNRMLAGQKPPYPVIAKSDLPNIPVEYRRYNGAGDNSTAWSALFRVDPATGARVGGLFVPFPYGGSYQMRTTNPPIDPFVQPVGPRKGETYYFEASPKNYAPKEIPPPLREGTCMPIMEPWSTNFDTVTDDKWRIVLDNIDRRITEDIEFRRTRQANLTQSMIRFNALNRRNENVNNVLENIMRQLQEGVNITALPMSNELKYIYEADKVLHETRDRLQEAKMIRWEREYQECLVPRNRGNGAPNNGAPNRQGRAMAG
ncbi:N,N'-diacetylchitobiase-like [Mya arenaria]|nr:N,N'-diacetylchitobiase-like [Mya arenaria]